MSDPNKILIAATAAKAIYEGRIAEGDRLLASAGDDLKTAATPLRLGLDLLGAGMPLPASVLLSVACQRAPRFAHPRVMLGHAFRERKLPRRAIACYLQAIAMNGADPEPHFHLGEAYLAIDDIENGRRALERADELKPNGMARMTLANLDRHEFRFEDAVRNFRRAAEILPDDLYEAKYCHTMLGISALLMGDYATGWSEYEWRLRHARAETHEWWNSLLPHWDGTLRPGLRLAVHNEQGLGDTLQFVRYCRWLRDHGVVVVLIVQRRLAPFLSRQTPPLADAVIVEGDPMPDCDAHVSLLSLPAKLLSTWGGMLFMSSPYFQVDPGRIEAVRDLVRRRAGGRPAIGIAWAGNPNYPQDRERSLTYDQLGPLLAQPDVAFFSLQLGPEQAKLAADPAPRMIDLADEQPDFETSAAIFAALDGVVTVDSAPVHLAGALGLPVALLLSQRNDFRWKAAPATDSPWYSSVVLYRQGADGEWGPVLEHLALRLGQGTAFDAPCPHGEKGV